MKFSLIHVFFHFLAVTWSRTLLKKHIWDAHLLHICILYDSLLVPYGSLFHSKFLGLGQLESGAKPMRHTCVTHGVTVPWLCHVCAMCIMSSDQFRPLVLVVAKTRHGCRLCRRSAGSSISNLAFWSPFVEFTLQCDLKQTRKSQFKPPFT